MVDLSRDGTTRGIEKGPQSLLTSPEGHYQVMLRSEESSAAVSATGIAKTQNGKTELPVVMNLSGLPSGHYKLAIQGDQDSTLYYYPVVLR